MASKALIRFSLRQAHVVWLVSIVNIGIGFFIPGFNAVANSISAVALEAPAFAFTHRLADIVIGCSMSLFAFGLHALSRKRVALSSISCFLLGLSFISAGIWTLETPLHLLYNLSIVMILVPIASALELKHVLRSQRFENLCLAVSSIHLFMFWCIYAEFIPQQFGGAIQRVWSAVLTGWFGVAASITSSRFRQTERGTLTTDAAPFVAPHPS
jgi:hypothetical protein